MILALVASAWAGEIAGTVLDADGQPVDGAYVVAYDQRFAYAYARTNAAGEYRIVELPANPYRLRVLPPPTVNLSETWLPTGLDVCGAVPVDLRDGDASGVDASLDVGGELTGGLLQDDGAPLAGATLIAYSTDPYSTLQPRQATSAADGSFSILGLAPEQGDAGNYRVEVQAAGVPVQSLPGVYEDDAADAWDVAPAETVDVGDATLLPGVTIGGAVNGPDGPVDGGTAYVYSPSQVVEAPIVGGRYRASGLPPGDVLSWANVDGYAMTYYPSSDRPDARVTVGEEGASYDALDLYLPREALLDGWIVGDSGQDLSGVTLLAYNDTHTVGIGAQADASGAFEVKKLSDGDWTLYVYAKDEGYVSDFARDANGEPTVFHLTSGASTSTGGLTLPRGAVVRGVVTDLATGEPVYGAAVRAQGRDSGRAEATSTGIDGTYEMKGLVADYWTVDVEYDAYCDADEDWVSVWYPEARDASTGRGLLLAAGDDVAWDVALDEDADHDDMGDTWERDNGLDPTGDDSAADPDGDGFTNLEEYRLGTDPTVDGSSPPGCGCGSGSDGGLIPLFGLGLGQIARRAYHRRRKREEHRCASSPWSRSSP